MEGDRTYLGRSVACHGIVTEVDSSTSATHLLAFWSYLRAGDSPNCLRTARHGVTKFTNLRYSSESLRMMVSDILSGRFRCRELLRERCGLRSPRSRRVAWARGTASRSCPQQGHRKLVRQTLHALLPVIGPNQSESLPASLDFCLSSRLQKDDKFLPIAIRAGFQNSGDGF